MLLKDNDALSEPGLKSLDLMMYLSSELMMYNMQYDEVCVWSVSALVCNVYIK